MNCEVHEIRTPLFGVRWVHSVHVGSITPWNRQELYKKVLVQYSVSVSGGCYGERNVYLNINIFIIYNPIKLILEYYYMASGLTFALLYIIFPFFYRC